MTLTVTLCLWLLCGRKMFGDFLFPLGSLIRLSVQGRPLSGPQCLTRSSSIMGVSVCRAVCLSELGPEVVGIPSGENQDSFRLLHCLALSHLSSLYGPILTLFSDVFQVPSRLADNWHLEPCFLVGSFFFLGIYGKHFFSPCRSENVYPCVH